MTILRFFFASALFASAFVAGCAPDGAASRSCDTKTDPCSFPACDSAEGVLACPSRCFGEIDLALDACAVGRSTQQVADDAAAGIAFGLAFQDLEAGLDQGQAFATDAQSVLVTLAESPKTDALRSGFSRQKAGLYRAPMAVVGTANVDATLRYAKDYQAGHAGDVILPDFFRIESYLEGANVAIQGGVATVSYQSVGPLVELIGLGPKPPNPFHLSFFDPTDNELQRLDLEIDAEQTLLGKTSVAYHATVHREVQEPSMAAIAIELSAVKATRDATKQVIQAPQASLFEAHDNLVVTLRGTVDFDVKGGAFDYHGRLVVKDRFHHLTVTCAP